MRLRGSKAMWTMLVGIVVAGVLVVILADGGDKQTAPTTSTVPLVSKADAEAFVTLWRRHRSGSWVVDGRYSRTSKGTVVLDVSARSVQAPPNYLEQYGANVAGLVEGETVACAAGPDGKVKCVRQKAPRSYDEQLTAEMKEIDDLVLAASPPYAVRLEDTCATLTLIGEITEPRFGAKAVACFDSSSGALVSSEIDRGNGVIERFVGSVTRTAVSAADLATP